MSMAVEGPEDDLALIPDDEAELDDAIAEAERDGWIPAEQVIAELALAKHRPAADVEDAAVDLGDRDRGQ